MMIDIHCHGGPGFDTKDADLMVPDRDYEVVQVYHQGKGIR